MKKNGSVSLNDIANKLGISKMTVSLALRDNPRISAKTRKKVQAAAQAMGYKPKPEVAKFMSAIRKQTTDERGTPLAYLTTGDQKGAWRHSPTECLYWQGAESRAKKYGYYLEEYWLDEPEMSHSRISDILWNRGISGLIVPPFFRTLSSQEHSVSLDLKWDLFSSVAISDMLTSPLLNRVIHDHYNSILHTMDKLCELGYSRIGLCLTEHMDFTVNQRWQAGYRVYRANHPIERIEPLIEQELTAKKVKSWINKHRLDAVISAERRMPAFIKDSGFKLGSEIAYADLDLDPDAPEHASVSGIIQNSEMMGMAAVDLLVAAIQRNETSQPEIPLVLQVEGTWIKAKTTPKRRIRRQAK